MGRLIDADEMKKNIAKWLKPSRPDEREMVVVDDIAISVMIEIEEQPTAHDVDKVVEELEMLKHPYQTFPKGYGDLNAYDYYIDSAIEIVKRGGIE